MSSEHPVQLCVKLAVTLIHSRKLIQRIVSLCLCFPIEHILCRHFHSSQNFIYKRFWLRHSFLFLLLVRSSLSLSLSLATKLPFEWAENSHFIECFASISHNTTLYPLFLAFHFLLLLVLCCWYKNHCRPIEQTDSERMLAFPFHWSISKQHCLTWPYILIGRVCVWFLLILMSPLGYCYVFEHKHYTILDI